MFFRMVTKGGGALAGLFIDAKEGTIFNRIFKVLANIQKES
jgi:hypothetical protein